MLRNFPITVLIVVAAVVIITLRALTVLGMSSENVVTAALTGLFALATGTGIGMHMGKGQRASDTQPPTEEDKP